MKPRQFLCSFLLALAFASVSEIHGADPAAVKHPNLLLNSQEIEAIQHKVRTQPWAAALFGKLKAGADGLDLDHHDGLRNTALLYALTGEKSYAVFHEGPKSGRNPRDDRQCARNRNPNRNRDLDHDYPVTRQN